MLVVGLNSGDRKADSVTGLMHKRQTGEGPGFKMNDITHSRLETYFRSVTKPVYMRSMGSLICLEERDGSHLLKCTHFHPGQDNLRNAALDAMALAEYCGAKCYCEFSPA
jgi:hypothetical protein